jgi:hypothetical protein
MGVAHTLTDKDRQKAIQTRANKKNLEEYADKLAQVADTASTYVRSYLDQPDPKKQGKSRLLVMTEAIYARACSGDVRAWQALCDRAYSKPSMAPADREAGRPILQMSNNQIIAQAPLPTSEPTLTRPVITIPSTLPVMETDAETNKTSENV